MDSLSGGTIRATSSAMLARPRLEAALSAGLSSTRVTILTAPAGSGKTVLLTKLRAQCHSLGYSVIEYPGNVRGTDLAGLWAQLREASGLAQSRNSSGIPRPPGPRVVLFLDDVASGSADGIADFVNGLLARDDGLVHPVLASRTRPTIEVAALRLQGMVTECDATQLAFTEVETMALLAVRPGRLNEGHIRRIHRRTEGWAVALQVIRRQFLAGADLGALAETFTGADRDIRAYLDETVFRHLDAGLQDFLRQISGLERVCPELAATVTGSPDAAAYCRMVIERDLFSIPLDRENRWFRLHSMFRDFLHAGGQSPLSGDAARRSARAALWHERHGNWIEAVDYALAAGDNRRAARWLRDCGADMLTTRGETVAFLRCCEKLPESALRDPELIVWMVWAAIFSASSAVASRLMTRHIATLETASEATDRVQLLLTLLAYFSYDFKTAILRGSAWMQEPKHGNAFDRATVAAMMAMALRTQLRQTEAVAWIATARREIASVPSPYGSAWVETIDAYFALIQGRAASACEMLEGVLADLPAGALMRGTAELVLADAYYECGRLDEARDLIARSLPTLADHGVAEFAYCGWRTAAMVALRDHGPGEALTVLRSGEPVAARRYGNREVLMLRLLQRELLAGVTDEARSLLAAEGVATPSLSGEPSDWCPELIERRKLLDARSCVIAGDPRQALRELQSVLAGARAEGRLRVWADASCIKAAALYADGDSQQATRCLIDCVHKVARLGLNRTLVDNAILLRPLGPLLAAYRAKGDGVGDVQTVGLLDRILEGMDLSPGTAAARRDPVSPPVALTAKERMILARVAEGLTNAEICEMQVLALPTVRWHLHNIFGKLGVSNRTAAVNKARMFGLFD